MEIDRVRGMARESRPICRRTQRRLERWPLLGRFGRVRVRWHARSCSPCAGALQRARSLETTLDRAREAYSALRYQGPPLAVSARLRSAEPAPVARWPPLRPPLRHALAGVLVVSMIVAAGLLMLSWPEDGDRPAQVPRAASDDQRAAPAVVVAPGLGRAPELAPGTAAEAMRALRRSARLGSRSLRPARPSGLSPRLPRRPSAPPPVPHPAARSAPPSEDPPPSAA